MRKPAAALITALLVTAAALPFVWANPVPWNTLFVYEGDVAPPSLAEPPLVTLSVQNDSSHRTSNITLNINVSLLGGSLIFHFGDLTLTYASPHLDSLCYEADWLTNHTYLEPTLSFSLNLTGVPEGERSIVVYAVEWRPYQSHIETVSDANFYNGFKIRGSSTVKFTVDLTTPQVSILSVQNKTFISPDVPLDFVVNEPVLALSYVLDGEDKFTISGNTTLSDLPVGEHNVTVYAWDAAGNVGKSETVTFTVAEPESFPTVPVLAASAVSIAAVTAGLFLFTRRRRRKEEQQT